MIPSLYLHLWNLGVGNIGELARESPFNKDVAATLSDEATPRGMPVHDCHSLLSGAR